MQPITVGVAGGSGSGKTTVVEAIVRHLGADRVAVIQHDSYYRDRSDIPTHQRDTINYDHPDALETSLLASHLERLRRGETVKIPAYDFSTHTRKRTTTIVEPKTVIVVEGILILADEDLRRLLDVKVFVDTEADLRILRRIRRDIAERGRTLESVVEQYLETVRPMHLEFVEPSKRHADVIIPEGGFNQVAMDMVVARLGELLKVEREE
jgi:uridine kinase